MSNFEKKIMRITLVRHGETNANVNGIVQGQLDTALNKSGIQQAQKVAKRLKDEKFDTIYSSDLKRAAQTAEEIAKYHTNIIKFDKRLRERNFGDYESQKMNAIDWSFLKSDLFNHKPSNGESLKEHFKRAEVFISDLSSGNHLIVSHGGTIRILIHLFQNKKLEEFSFNVRPKNTSIYIFERKTTIFELILENCDSHLN
jgi:broad specificity phosphatase PhoE